MEAYQPTTSVNWWLQWRDIFWRSLHGTIWSRLPEETAAHIRCVSPSIRLSTACWQKWSSSSASTWASHAATSIWRSPRRSFCKPRRAMRKLHRMRWAFLIENIIYQFFNKWGWYLAKSCLWTTIKLYLGGSAFPFGRIGTSRHKKYRHVGLGADRSGAAKTSLHNDEVFLFLWFVQFNLF